MEVYLYLLVILFIIILSIENFNNKKKEKFESIESLKMNENKLSNFDFPEIPQVIELQKLEECSEIIDYKLGYNQNYIWNNGKEIGFDILRSLSRNYLIHGKTKRFNIRSIRIGKCNILDKNKSYLLQITLITSDESGLCNFKIVIPIEFSIEDDIKLFNKTEIPQFKCCGKKYGKVLKKELGKISDFLNNTTFKRYNINKKKHLIISQPAKISVDLGLDIINKLKSKGESEILKKSSWLEIGFLEL